ncbi:MAG: beta-ketoacyl synthase N-terminal-like domain-containing protein [Minicystis sp.]
MADRERDEEIDGIAVIGMSGRFPGARTVDDLWRDLRAGVERIVPFTEAELVAAGVSPEELSSPRYVRAGAPIEHADLFDAPFFGVSPREAQAMDPQHRLFLEVAWEALERGGHDPAAFPGLVGIFAGSGVSDYRRLAFDDPALVAALGPIGILLGNEKDHLTTRASYKLDLRGPSVCVQTACSTSLVAVCLACQSLLDHECDLALAGGVSVRAAQRAGYEHREGGLVSPDGHCRAFDAAAAGSVWGNGIGVVALRRLADAIADGDHVHAVIRGAAVNNDGSRKVGYTAPSVAGLAEVIAAAQALAAVDPDTLGFVEAHGTGTPLGDSVEVAALTRVFRARTKRTQFCALGSIKPNIGHLDAASGVTSLIKAVLAVEHGEIPGTLHFERPSPALDLDRSPFFVSAKATPWPVPGLRRAGVSAFGMGGTNAHVILEQAPPRPPVSPARSIHLLTLSARSEAALSRASAELAAHLAGHPEVSLADVAYTGHVGRRAFPVRRVVVGRSRDEIMAALTTSRDQITLASPAGARESDPEFAHAEATARAWAGGGEIDWTAFHAGETRLRVPLPTYPFEGRRYWPSPSTRTCASPAQTSVPTAGAKHPRPLLRGPFVAPGTEIERRVASIWEDLLGLSEVGLHDGFLELGGHSLLATRVLSWIRDDLGAEIPLPRFFDDPTVAGLARLVEAARAEPQSPAGARIPRARRAGQRGDEP